MILDNYLTAREMTAIEMNTEYIGVSRLQLMENAGRAVADAVKKRFKPGSRITVVCGTGGNGGDGFVAARHLAEAGYYVEVILLGSANGIKSEEALFNWRVVKEMRSSVLSRENRDSVDINKIKADITIDALIGTGVKGALGAPFREMVDAINESESFIVAVDVPTGVDSDTGAVKGAAVEANLTITFHKPKFGFKKLRDHIGELIVCPIGIPPEAELFAGPGDAYLASRSRLPESHKGDFGRLLVIGGSEIYSGAPALTALGAYACGVDLVYLAAPEAVASIIASFSPSLITVKLKGGWLTQRNIRKIHPFLEMVDAVALGPGLGLNNETLEAADTLLGWIEGLKLPLLLDADGLKAYAQSKRELKTRFVLTPHCGEFKILTGKEVQGKYSERGRLVQKVAAKLGGTILLKGSVDIISDGSHTRYNWTGNPGMTVGGTGDVLSGLTAGLMAMGSTPFEAAVAGAFINGAAGDAAYKEKGYHLTPMDLVERIPKVMEDALSGRMRMV